MSPLHQRYLDTIRRTQWLSPDRLINYQAQLLQDIARHAYEAVPFYRDRLAPLFRGADIDLRAWREVPILKRTEALANVDAMHALFVPRFAARDSSGRTSGTTGQSLAFWQSELAGLASTCLHERLFESHEIDKAAHMARIHLAPPGAADYPEGTETSGWNLTCPDAKHSVLNIHCSVEQQVDWLERRAPAYLSTYQSTASALARSFEIKGRSLSLEAIFTSGETIDASTRDDIRRALGCEVIDRYATNEIGHIASQCPEGGGYHICSEAVLLELLDDSGKDVAPGERGRVVLTSFYNFAMPFIRYDLGDLAVAAPGACRCGSTLPRLEAILGRQRNVFTFADGSQYSPWKWRAIFKEHLPRTQVQLVQTAPDRIELRYVPRDGMVEPDSAAIEKIGRDLINPLVKVVVLPVAEIARHPSGKIEDCVSYVTPP
jgi:phenylacetate-CoA ligase